MIKHREYYCVTDRLIALLLIQKTVWEIHVTSIFIQMEPRVAYIKRELIIVNRSNQVLIKYVKSEANAALGFHYYVTL